MARSPDWSKVLTLDSDFDTDTRFFVLRTRAKSWLRNTRFFGLEHGHGQTADTRVRSSFLQFPSPDLNLSFIRLISDDLEQNSHYSEMSSDMPWIRKKFHDRFFKNKNSLSQMSEKSILSAYELIFRKDMKLSILEPTWNSPSMEHFQETA